MFLSEETFKAYVESRLPRADDRELFLELLNTHMEEGRDGVRKALQKILSQLEEE